MTDIRTYSQDVKIEKVGQLTTKNFAYNYITRFLAYYNSPQGRVYNYGFRPDYDNTGVGKTVWSGERKFKSRLVDNNNIAIVGGATPTTLDTHVGYFRCFFPNPVQLYEVGTGLHSGVLDDLLKEFDAAYLRGAKVLWTIAFLNATSKISMRAFGHVLQCSAAYETNLLNFLNALFDSTQTSTLGFTVANHPGFGAIECGNENTATTHDNTGTDQAGSIHANIVRLVHGVVKTKEVITGAKTEGIKILPFAGSGGVQADFNDLYGAEARSQASTNLGVATLDSATDVLSLASHPLTDWEQVLCEAVDFPETYAQYQTYYAVNASANTFQLSLTSGGAPVAASTVNGIMDTFVNANTLSDDGYTVLNANICTYDFATNTFTQNAHLIANTNRVKLVGRIGSTSADAGISAYRRYWVRDVVAGVSFKLSATLNGAALNLTQNANVRIHRNVPAVLNGDTGVSRFIPHYVDVLCHHFYDNINSTAAYAIQNNARSWDRIMGVHEYANYVPFELYRKWGVWNRGVVTRSGNTLTSQSNLNLKPDTRLQISGTTLPTGLSRDVIYYPVNINNATKSFDLSLTQGGAVITLTTAGTSVNVNILHPWYGQKKRPALWNTESNMSEQAGFYSAYITKSLDYEKRKDLLRAFMLAKLMKTDDGNGGFGVDFFYGTEEGSSNLASYNVTIGTVNGHLKATFASAPTAPAATEQITLQTNAAAIAGVMAANSEKAFNILNVLAANEFELDAAYTGGTVADVQGIVESWYHNGAQEYIEIKQELCSAELSVGWTARNNDGRLGIFYALKGIGAWYYDSTGVRRQW